MNGKETAKAFGLEHRRKVTRVKLFRANWCIVFEDQLNTWLAERGPAFRLIDIKYNNPERRDFEEYSALVIYEDLDMEPDEEAQGDD